MPESLTPETVCEYRAGERIAWTAHATGERCTGIIHEIRWDRWTWLIGAWIEGAGRQMKDGKPRLHWFPIAAGNVQIERVN